mmetsp:Transcript_13946/g.29399  ORF Transcript_13946/g.29399 Transcript_13946/m.29399 type:complete len:131 (+) Transcript_13946:159-551(+)
MTIDSIHRMNESIDHYQSQSSLTIFPLFYLFYSAICGTPYYYPQRMYLEFPPSNGKCKGSWRRMIARTFRIVIIDAVVGVIVIVSGSVQSLLEQRNKTRGQLLVMLLRQESVCSMATVTGTSAAKVTLDA